MRRIIGALVGARSSDQHNEIWQMQTSGGILPLRLNHSLRARHIALRLSSRSHEVKLVIPPGCRLEKAYNFARKHEGWIRAQLESRPPAIPFTDGQIIPLRGKNHIIMHKDQLRGQVRCRSQAEDIPLLVVPSPPEHLARRLGDWLKGAARRDLHAAVQVHAKNLNVKPGRISVRDQTSRWGSCSSRGNLNFSWRLILSPPEVLEYVAAHEVAHLLEMNHSERFWQHVRGICPDMKASRRWLRKNGNQLHRYGRNTGGGTA